MAVADIDIQTVKTSSQLRHAVKRVVVGIFSLVALVNLLALVLGDSPYFVAHLAAIMLAAYLAFEAVLYLRRTDALGMLSPVFLALIAHFLLAYLAAISIAPFDPWAIRRFEVFLPDLDTDLAETLLLAMLGAFCMLRSYYLFQSAARRLRRRAQSSSALRREFRPAFTCAVILQFAFVGLVALALTLGVYGVVGTGEARQRHSDVLEILRLATAAGTLSYFLILLRYYHLRATGRASWLFGVFCAALVVLHLCAGILSGFKSQMVAPFIIAGLAYFLATRRLPKTFIVMGFFALVISYSIIEPFRAYLGAADQRPRGMIETVEAVATAVRLREHYQRHTDISRGEQITSRFDLAGMSTVGLDYVRRGDLQTEFRQGLQDSILLSPILAYVPRAIWRDKPFFGTGIWFNVTVLGRSPDARTSVAMGPIAFLYMAGGVAWVCLGFALWGAIGALLFDGLARSGAGGTIVFLSVASTLIFIPTTIGPNLTGILRMLPVAFVAQLILLRPRSRPVFR
ncbi:hypothetical protein [Histidinibacterium lentulum]|uniref:O-antigen polysaccharide polymerase Wzy n=1 Tax=Histidinibacterium lentulum TaxID=2480588 RepID=A0A3N2QVM8_9RHOB|nr:hypothetical protein [Histidinibacterium lentulum]ROT99095.1 hypothetical protein EAT49_15895 [Histidinibacterium lentulum]